MNIPCHIPLNVVENPCFHGSMSVKSPFIIRMTEDMSIKSLPRIIAESRGKDIEALGPMRKPMGFFRSKNWRKKMDFTSMKLGFEWPEIEGCYPLVMSK